MAVIGGGVAQQAALERGALNYLAGSVSPQGVVTGVTYGNGTTPIELALGSESPNPIIMRSFALDILVALNGGTVTGGTLAIDVSEDGINWVDSGVTPVAVPTTDGGYTIIPCNEYAVISTGVPTFKLPARYARGKIAGATSTGAPTVAIRLVA